MTNRTQVIRIYSELEATSEATIYDILEDGENGQTLHRGVSFDSIEPSLQTRLADPSVNVILLVPAEQVGEIALGVVQGKHAKVSRAAPFLVEESLATELSTVHAVTAIDRTSSEVRIAVVQHDLMKSWLASFKALGITISAIYRDTDAIAGTDSEKVLFITGNRAILAGFISTTAIALCNLGVFLRAQPAGEPMHSLQIIAISCKTRQIQALSELDLEGDIVEREEHWFPDNYQLSPHAINLAQNNYSPTKAWNSLKRPQWTLIVSIFIALLFQIFNYLGMGLYYDLRAATVQEDTIAVYRELFPADKKIINVKAQLRNHLDRLTDSPENDDFVSLFYLSLLELHTIANLEAGQLHYLQYQSSTSRLNIEVAFDSVQQLDQLEKKLSAYGLITMIESITQENDLYIGKMSVYKECRQC